MKSTELITKQVNAKLSSSVRTPLWEHEKFHKKKKDIKLFLGTQGNIDTIANISLHEMLESLYFSIYYLSKQLVLAIIKLEFVNHCISGRYKKYV